MKNNIIESRVQRNSSLELLRIVAMLMIVAHHFTVQGVSFSTSSISLNRLWSQFLWMGGSLGNDIFVLISGYFLIESKGIKFRRLFNLWLRIFLYSVIREFPIFWH